MFYDTLEIILLFSVKLHSVTQVISILTGNGL